MFSFKKQLSKINSQLFQKDDTDKYDLYSINYTLHFENKDNKLKFYKSIAFYFCLDNYENEISVNQDFIEFNNNTDEFIIIDEQSNLKKMNKLNISSGSHEVITYKACNNIQPSVNFSTMDVQSILNYMEKEISFGYDEAKMYFDTNQISTTEAKDNIEDTFLALNNLFKNHFFIDTLREDKKFILAEIIHNNIYLNNVIPSAENKKINHVKF